MNPHWFHQNLFSMAAPYVECSFALFHLCRSDWGQTPLLLFLGSPWADMCWAWSCILMAAGGCSSSRRCNWSLGRHSSHISDCNESSPLLFWPLSLQGFSDPVSVYTGTFRTFLRCWPTSQPAATLLVYGWTCCRLAEMGSRHIYGPVALPRTDHRQYSGHPTTARPHPAWTLPWRTLPGWERRDGVFPDLFFFFSPCYPFLPPFTAHVACVISHVPLSLGFIRQIKLYCYHLWISSSRSHHV